VKYLLSQSHWDDLKELIPDWEETDLYEVSEPEFVILNSDWVVKIPDARR